MKQCGEILARPVDVAINVYGKPWQTLASLLSLCLHSRRHLGRLYFVEEPVQPFGDRVDHIPRLLRQVTGMEVVHFVPPQYVGYKPCEAGRLADQDYRLSIKYQYAWENCRDLLFVLHNDMLFEKDEVGEMLARLSDHCGVGAIGQCWSCPGREMGCNGDKYTSFHPTYSQVLALLDTRFPRTTPENIDKQRPMPLPECRLNEFACLLDVTRVRHRVCPLGPVEPFGFFWVDLGVRWFRRLNLEGFTFKNYQGHMQGHAWVRRRLGLTPAGHSSLAGEGAYRREEEFARRYVLATYRVDSPA